MTYRPDLVEKWTKEFRSLSYSELCALNAEISDLVRELDAYGELEDFDDSRFDATAEPDEDELTSDKWLPDRKYWDD